MNTQLKKGILELCVLSVISKQDSYGYEIIDQIKDKIPMSEGTIYPMLRRLKNDKYLEDYTEQSESGPSRKYYKITDEGKTHLHSQLEDYKKLVESVKALLEEGF